MIVLDASVLLASVFQEPGSEVWAEAFGQSVLSAVNLSEVVAKLEERQVPETAIAFLISELRPISQALTLDQAIQAGRLRKPTRHLGLSLGDRCCLALGLDLGAEVWTTDRSWAGLDLGVRIRVVRQSAAPLSDP